MKIYFISYEENESQSPLLIKEFSVKKSWRGKT